MQFASFEWNGERRAGVLRAEELHLLRRTGTGDDLLEHIRSGASAPELTAEMAPLSAVRLRAPLAHPPRIFGIGLNYREHAAESKMQVQKVPTVFLKLASSLCGSGDDVLLPPNATDPDYEAELAVVIGKAGHRIAAESWEEHVFGYTILNDVSARGVQLATTQWNLGKSFPTFTPLGPYVVTRDEIADPHALDIRLTLAGEVMQNANTRDLLFRIPELLVYLSSIVALEPGDIVSTGTPPGVGLGRTPPRWIRDGEEMVIDITGLGTLRNRARSVG